MTRALCAGLFLLVFSAASSAQEGQPFLERLKAEDPAALDAVVLYPEDVREAIFVASTEPGLLLRLQNMQNRSKAAFEELIDSLEGEDQKKFWELGRYPELIAAMAAEKKLKKKELAEVLRDYPTEIHGVAQDFNKRHREAVRALHALNEASNAAFAALIEPESREVQAAFKALIGLPELLDILNRNIALTAELGDIFARNPEGVRARAAELGLEAARRNAEADQAWVAALEEDPEAIAEMQRASQEFSDDSNDADYVYKGPSEPPKEASARITYVYYPYPYWYGYPRWWYAPYWYPRPVWYHAGFYVGPGGVVIVVGTPSYHYTHWHFHIHHHHYHYAHLSHHYARHYHHHRHHRHGAAEAIRDWERENRDHLPGDWAERRSSPDWFREYGRFEQQFGEFRARNPESRVTRDQFLNQNAERFPGLAGRDGDRPAVADRRPPGDRRQTLETRDRNSFEKYQRANDQHGRGWDRQRADRTERRGGRQGQRGSRRNQ